MSLSFYRNVLAKGWKRFYVMHMNRKVASIREDGTCTVYFPSFMPYNLHLEKAEKEDIDTRVNNLTNFYYWCASRMLTLDRKYAKEILSAIDAPQAVTDKERAQIALSCRCLSLTDVYWVRFDREVCDYDSICLFDHSLSGAFANVSLAGKQLTVQNRELLTIEEAAGDVSTHGVAPKAWIRENGVFYLLKDGDERDVKAELLASRVIDCFSVPHVSYYEASFEGKTVSRSEIITSRKYSIVPMEYIEIYCLNHDLDRDDLILKKAAYDYYMMNIVDYLIGNTDRHGGNWGFMADNRTNRLTGLYPLMDYNKAFSAYENTEGGKCQTVPGNITQKAAAVDAVKRVGLNMIDRVDASWFESAAVFDMFTRRLEILRSAASAR